MQEFNQLMSSIEKGDYKPFYLLSGTEPYFIDRIEFFLTKKLTHESSHSFDYSLFYGGEVEQSQIIESAKRFPLLASHHLVVVREAQHLDKSTDFIADYLSQPQFQTVIVFCYKHKPFDKRKKLYKAAQKVGAVLNTKKLYDNQLSHWISQRLKSAHFIIDSNSLQILLEALGSDLNKIEKEIDKLKIVLEKGSQITPELIEQHIGFSKDYNNFELYKAVAKRDFYQCSKIVKYMSENPKNHPLILTISGFYNFFRRLLLYHCLEDKSKAASLLGVNPYFVNDYEQACKKFSIKQASKAISFTLEADLKSKGVGVKYSAQYDILQDLIVKVFAV
ncbi:MAG: DNA polymerase III subunit delta [Pelagibacteraceae bacterium TMED216]|nr:MAG: DNA polymerase III subunit delta [Pelagibacteraceae bacterium TMED216]|tara:strand:+ start:5594 stop:6595 length:1002 start_codon:yes stop_codon:yes gene_type:complete